MNNNQKRVLVTGGTGELGRALIPRLQRAGYQVRITSRFPAPADKDSNLEWAQVNIITAEGMAQSARQTPSDAAPTPVRQNGRRFQTRS